MPIDSNYYDWAMKTRNNAWSQEDDGVIYTKWRKFNFDDLLEYTKNPSDDLRKKISESIVIEDIIYSLSKISRFGGHCNRTWSVAEHSVFVAKIIESLLTYENYFDKSFVEATFLLGLLHDAAEAYLGDMISPLKRHFPQLKQMEKALIEIIIEKYTRIDHNFFKDKNQYNEALKIVNYADMMAYFIEHTYLLESKKNDPVRRMIEHLLSATDEFSNRFNNDMYVFKNIFNTHFSLERDFWNSRILFSKSFSNKGLPG